MGLWFGFALFKGLAGFALFKGLLLLLVEAALFCRSEPPIFFFEITKKKKKLKITWHWKIA